MTEKCPRCGAPLPADILGGHCPGCLVAVSLESALQPAIHRASEQPAELLPRTFGDFELLEELARGGMGVVYRARQISLNRVVALKVILSGPFASPTAIGRFRAEARTVATLQHPNIVAIHEVGETEGQPYFTMDFIEGGNLADLVRDGPLPAGRAARYLAQVARAVHHAHLHGVLHRDLKPSNVLIDAFDQPRVTDFGLARRLDVDARLTVTGQMLGSPAYMAPEQATPRQGEAGTPAEVYSLGALLYHLISGRPPFAAGTMAETFEQVLNGVVVAPRWLNPAIPADLETVCLKCLEREPSRRYGNALELAADLERFLAGQPVVARPISRLERSWRWCRRRPLVAALTGTVGVLLAALLVASWFAAWRIEIARRAEVREAAQAARANSQLAHANVRLSRSLSVLELQRAEESFRSGDAGAGLAQLAGILRREPTNHIAAERLLSALVYRNLALPAGPPLRHPGKVHFVEYSADGRWLLTVCADGAARVWDARLRKEVAVLRHDRAVISACFSPDGERVLTGSEDGTARLWNWRQGNTVLPPLPHGARVGSVALSPDGTRIATGGDDHAARIWSTETGRLVATISGSPSPVVLVKFSPDGATLLTTSSDFAVRASDTRTGEATGLIVGHQSWVTGMVFSPDGRRLFTASRDHTLAAWDARTGVPVSAPFVHPDGLNAVAFNSDGRLLVTSCMDNCARVWDVPARTLRFQALRHVEQVNSAAFSPDGQSLATACLDGNVHFWDLRWSSALTEPMRPSGTIRGMEFSPDGRLLAAAGADGAAVIWDRETARPVAALLRHGPDVQSIHFSPDGGRVVTASADRSAWIWDVRDGRPVAGPFLHQGGLWSARFSPDGNRIVTASADHTARVWDINRTASPRFTLSHGGEVYVAEYSRDGSRIVTASADGTARIWDAETGRPVAGPLTHIDRVIGAEFSPDGRWVATASADNTAGIWDAVTGALRAPLLRHARTVQTIQFSPDGRRVVTASLDHAARIWSAETGEPLTPPLQHDDEVLQARYSPDGRHVATAAANGTVRLWDADAGLPVSEPLAAGAVRRVVFSPDGRWLAAGSAQPDPSLRVWRVPSVDEPVPEWLPTLAEVVAGLAMGPYASFQEGPRTTLSELARQIDNCVEQNACTIAARWFVSDRGARTSSPYGETRLREYVQRRIDENTRASLEEAIRMEPTNAVALARLAMSELKGGPSVDGDTLADAQLLARRARYFDPEQKEAGEVFQTIQSGGLSTNSHSN